MCVSYAEARLSYSCLSVRHRLVLYKTAEHIVMLFSPHDSPFILVLCISRSSRNSEGVTPCGAAKLRRGMKMSQFSTNTRHRYIAIFQKWLKIDRYISKAFYKHWILFLTVWHWPQLSQGRDQGRPKRRKLTIMSVMHIHNKIAAMLHYSLPNSIVLSSTVASFKRKLHSLNFIPWCCVFLFFFLFSVSAGHR